MAIHGCASGGRWLSDVFVPESQQLLWMPEFETAEWYSEDRVGLRRVCGK